MAIAQHRSRSTVLGPLGLTQAGVARGVLAVLFGSPASRPFRVRLWDGSVEGPAGATAFTLVIQRPGALRRMLLPPTELNLGEAYLRDDFDVEGDLETATGLMDALTRTWSPAALAGLLPRLLLLPTDDLPGRPGARKTDIQAGRHSRDTDLEAVRFHYDVSNDFYKLWLDERLVYSCAYFRTGEESLDEAQEAKLDLICRKLRLQPGERLLDIGCGWGGLLIHAAERYGVSGVGVTLSEAQAELARERILARGLADRVRVEVRDYRDLPGGSNFDKIVSVGMFEHVGREHLPEYFAQAYRLLRPGGLFLNHGIIHPRPDPARHPVHQAILRFTWRYTSFLERYVFPGGELVTPGTVLSDAEAAGFETRDLESLREHYVLTLRHWVRRLEANHEEVAAVVGEGTYRIWRMYMAAVSRSFNIGLDGLVQVLFSKPHADGRTELPRTREDLYLEPGQPAIAAD